MQLPYATTQTAETAPATSEPPRPLPDTPVPAPAAPAVLPPRPRTRPAQPRRLNSYERVMQIAGLTAALCVAALLWAVGAHYTLVALAPLLPGQGRHLAALAVPLAISLIEIGLWPARLQPWASRTVWLVALALDAGTTAWGAATLLTAPLPQLGRPLPLPNLPLWFLALSGGVALALLPERLARSYVTSLRRIIREVRS